MEHEQIDSLSNLYLKRKRLIEINGEDDEMYGEGEQDSFVLVYSPDRLDTEYPLSQYSIKLSKTISPDTYKDKSEYFSVSELRKLIDPIEAPYGQRIYVKRYESLDKLTDCIEDPIDDFLNSLKIWILYHEEDTRLEDIRLEITT
jgi:hypothetical protein